MAPEKKLLSVEEIEAQTALQLPERKLLSLVTITNVANGNKLTVTVTNNRVGVEVCAAVGAIARIFHLPLKCSVS